MAWNTSNRRARLPKNWAAIRAAVLKRDGYRCCHVRTDTGLRCTEAATEVDHIKAGDDHSEGNLQSLCVWHHARKSSREGASARLQRPAVSRKRPPERHPGAL